jgi:peroxiredoxin
LYRTFVAALGAILFANSVAPLMAAPPRVGERAPDFTLSSLEGDAVRLSDTLSGGPVVLIVLRGYPGYQCPFCNRQANDFLRHAELFRDAGAKVIMIYPGPGQDLPTRAKEFAAGKTFPSEFRLLLDPDYKMTNLYGLRWDAPGETAYPSTFLLDSSGVIFFAKVSDSHGGRTTATEAIELLKKHPDSK